MLKRILIVSCLILFAISNNLAAKGLVPFQGKLGSTGLMQFQEIKDALEKEEAEAISLARSHYLESASHNSEIEAWSLLVYAHVLVENDSIQHAIGLLRKPAPVDWQNVLPWIRAYRQWNLGEISMHQGNYLEAHRYYEEAASFKNLTEVPELQLLLTSSIAENLKYLDQVLVSYQNLADLHQKHGEYEQAFAAQRKLIELTDSLAVIQRSGRLSEMEMKYEAQQREHELRSLRQKQTIVTNRWLTLAIGLFSAIIIGILFVDNQKRKHRQQTQLLTKEDELKKAEIQIVTDLLEYNQKKLKLYTENLLNKNELVNQLEEKLKRAVEGKGNELAEDQNLVKDFSAVRILTDEDWEGFKELFEQVHHGMLDRLLQSHQNLTLGEQRLFLLMKLELSTKEIANILGVSPDSVKKGRYRLKKKIGAADTTSLQDFVTSF